MDLPNWVTRRSRELRLASSAVLAALAVRSLRNGNRLRALLAGGGAVAVGATAATLEPTAIDEQALDVTVEPDGLQCSVCKESIVPGQPRRPTAENKPAHEACLS